MTQSKDDLIEKIILESVTWSDGMVSDKDFAGQVISIVLDEAIEAVKNEPACMYEPKIGCFLISKEEAIKAIEGLKGDDNG